MDKLLSIVMAIVLLFTAVANVIPVESQATDLKNTTLDNDISIEGTNSFGNMLSAELDSEVEEQEENNGYNVFSAEVAGTEVAVSFETMSDCTLLAAIYDEAGESLIASGTAQVTEEEIEKTVTIETGEMPQYFYLKVYLVDENTMRPMCTAYESPNYTQEMQEFFALTVDDFESERVLNLDEDETNNFAVYGEDVIIIESDETVNTVTAADIENENYVIENADSTVTSLQIGDVFVIEQTSGELLIVKVGEIIVDDATATITGEDTEMEEVFEIVKIDTTQTNEEATVDTSNMGEGVTYEGKTEDSTTVAEMISGGNKKISGDAEVTVGDTFSFNFTKIGEEDFNVTVSGSLSVNMTIELECYISFKRQYIKFTIEDSIGINFSITGAIKTENKLTSFDIPVCPGIELNVDMKFVIEVSGAISTEGKLTNKTGFSFEYKSGDKTYKNLSSRPKYKDTISGSATFFIGVVFEPNLSFLSKKILKLGLEASLGAEVSAEEVYYEDSTEKYPEQKHACQSCIEGKICGKLELSFNLKFLNSDKFSYKKTFVSAKRKLFDFYISSTFGDQGFKTCPHQLYRLTIKAVDENGNAVPYAVISDGLNKYTADSKGKLIIYKKAKDKSTYKVSSGNISVKMEYKMPKESASITVTLKAPEVITQPVTTVSSTTTETTTTETTTTTTDSSVAASGTCGENLTWVLENGTLTISGTGDMEYGEYSSDVPWYNYHHLISHVIIEEGVTSIGDGAFSECYELTSITIPDSVISIGDSAFYKCSALNPIPIPDSVTSIGEGAFLYCTSLTEIAIPESVTSIGEAAFAWCDVLTAINVDTENKFYTSVDGVLFNKDMTTIIRYPENKKNKVYTIPDSVTSIAIHAFSACYALTKITIPDSVTSIGSGAFGCCSSLTFIKIPNGVTSIAATTFYECSSLTEVIIPGSVINIDDTAFLYCYSLTDVYYASTEDQWKLITTDLSNLSSITSATIHYNNTGEALIVANGTCGKNLKWVLDSRGNLIVSGTGDMTDWEAAYDTAWHEYQDSIKNVVIENGVTSIGNYAFGNCYKLLLITISGSVTNIGSHAFDSCTSLTSITIPDSVTSIGKYAFNDCYALTETTISNSIKSIADYVFYDCSALTEIAIPNSVTSIGNGVFSNCSALASITIPDSILSIGNYAFNSCSSLTEITIPESVTSIGDDAFNGTSWYNDQLQESPFIIVNNILIDGKNCEGDVVIPDSVISIRDKAFYECSALTSITIPDSVTSIGYNSFESCVALTTVEIGNSVTSIGDEAFIGCSALTSITFPESVTSIGYYAFFGTPWLEAKRQENPLVIVSSILIDGTTCEGDVIIPESVTSIGDMAFYYCRDLTSIIIPNSVISIGKQAFSSCDALTSITIPDSVTSIGDRSFYSCDTLTSITIPDSVTSIGDGAFGQCSALTEITIPNNVTQIGDKAFYECSALTSITLPDSVTSIEDGMFSQCSSLTEITIPNSITSIGTEAFYSCSKLSSITIPSSVTNIGYNAFFKCYALTSITLPDSITSIGEGIFENCKSLTSIIIPDGVTSIGNKAFYGCEALTEITIPDNVTSIGNKAFYGCEELTSITLPDSIASIGDGIFENCKSLTSIIIPDGVTSIGNKAFHGCKALTEITIPDNVTNIGDESFAACYALLTITIPNNITSIGDRAFAYCDVLTAINVDADNSNYASVDGVLFNKDMKILIQYPEAKTDKSYTIPDEVTSIGDDAFHGCETLTEITIPNSVTSIGDYAFAYSKALTSITIPDSVTSIGDYAFNCCYALSTITISDSLTSIGKSPFLSCSALTALNVADGSENITSAMIYVLKDFIEEVSIPDSVTSIGDDAFAYSKALTSITIPDSVTSIGKNAFRNCNALISVTIGNGVTSIGDRAFAYCDVLTAINVDADNINYVSVDGVLFKKDMTILIQYPKAKTDESYTIPDSVTNIGDYAFDDGDALTSITIPESVTSIGKYAFDYCNALTDVYYTGTEEQWNEITISSDNDDLTDATIHYNSTGEVSTASFFTIAKTAVEETTLLTKSFTALLPNEVYNFYVMKSRTAENPFSGENLLYVTQGTSDGNGRLTVSYIPKEAFETADIFVAGLTRTDISAAEATVHEITYTGEEILVNPEVTLNGQALIEGIDYDIEGGYLVTQPGDYTITIVGNGDYIGEKDIMFTAICIHSYDGQICMICGNKNPDILEFLLGDVNNDGSVDSSDASLVLAEYAKIQTGGAGEFSENQLKAADVNNDSVVDSSDASKILAYYAMVSTGKEPTWD